MTAPPTLQRKMEAMETDFQFIDPLPDRLTCATCLSVVQSPHVVSCCGNQFCESCIQPVKAQANACPLCNSPSFTTLLHKGVEREVRSLKVCCPNESRGCEWKGELGSLDAHTALALGAADREGKGVVCGYALILCPNGCGEKVQRRNLRQHELESCPASHQLLKKFKSKFLEQEKEIELLKNKVATLEALQMPTPPFYFTVHNFEHLKKENLFWTSRSFYSHKMGYKMCITGQISGKYVYFGANVV